MKKIIDANGPELLIIFSGIFLVVFLSAVLGLFSKSYAAAVPQNSASVSITQ